MGGAVEEEKKKKSKSSSSKGEEGGKEGKSKEGKSSKSSGKEGKDGGASKRSSKDDSGSKKSKLPPGGAPPPTARQPPVPRPPAKKAAAGAPAAGAGYLAGMDLPSSSESEEEYEKIEREEKGPLIVQASAREEKKLADKERMLMEKAHRCASPAPLPCRPGVPCSACGPGMRLRAGTRGPGSGGIHPAGSRAVRARSTPCGPHGAACMASRADRARLAPSPPLACLQGQAGRLARGRKRVRRVV